MMLYEKSKQNTGFELLKKAKDYFDSDIQFLKDANVSEVLNILRILKHINKKIPY